MLISFALNLSIASIFISSIASILISSIASILILLDFSALSAKQDYLNPGTDLLG